MPTVQVNDIQVYYEMRGEGQPLLIICGLAIDLSEIESITNWFAQRFRVVVFDNRGVGRTDKPDCPYSIEMMAEDTLELLRALHIERTAVLGFSMGGRIALEMALRAPERVSSLVLVSTSARVPSTARRRLLLRLSSLLSYLPRFRSTYPQPRYAFLRQLQASGAYNCANRLQEITLPTLIMHGQDDRTAPYVLAEEMHKGIPGSQMLVFQGGHGFFLMRERQRFFEASAEFLSKELR